MSKAITKFGDRVTSDPKLLGKLFKNTSAGSRLLPSQSEKNDAEFECRVDMGEELSDKPGVRNVYLQVNSQAKSQALKNWLAKNPHGNLATAQIDLNSPKEKQKEVGTEAMNTLVERGKENLG